MKSGDDRQVCHRLLQRLALVRRGIIGIYFPPIPWPMTTIGHAICAWFGCNPCRWRLVLGAITTMYLSDFMVSPPLHGSPLICIYIHISIVAVFVIWTVIAMVMDGKGRCDGDLTVINGKVRRQWTARRRLNRDGQQWTERRQLESSRWIDSDGRLLGGDGRCSATAMDGTAAR